MPPEKIQSREFKLEALRLLKSSGKTKIELEREPDRYQGELHLWEKAFDREEAACMKLSRVLGAQVMRKPS
jgi:hypothetical protein